MWFFFLNETGDYGMGYWVIKLRLKHLRTCCWFRGRGKEIPGVLTAMFAFEAIVPRACTSIAHDSEIKSGNKFIVYQLPAQLLVLCLWPMKCRAETHYPRGHRLPLRRTSVSWVLGTRLISHDAYGASPTPLRVEKSMPPRYFVQGWSWRSIENGGEEWWGWILDHQW